ncbi:MAG: coiled-coil domain-containing protein, partial [Planctomycetota bacterium]
LGKVADGDKAVHAIEQRLQEGIADAGTAAETLRGTIRESANSAQVLDAKVGAVDVTSEQAGALVEAVEQAGERAASVVSQARSAADQLTGRITHVEKIIEDFEGRLEDHLVNGRNTVDTAREVVSQASQATDALQTEIGAARKESHQIVALTETAGEATRKAQAVIADAGAAATELLGKVADGQTAMGAIEHRLRTGIADGESTAEGLSEAIGQASNSAQTLQSDIENAERRSGQMWSATKAAKEAGAEASLLVEQARGVGQQLSSSIANGKKVIEEVENHLRVHLADGKATADGLTEATAHAGDTAQALHTEIGVADEKAAHLSSLTSAAREASRQAAAVVADAHAEAARLRDVKTAAQASAEEIQRQTETTLCEGRAGVDKLRQEVCAALGDADLAVKAAQQRLDAACAFAERDAANLEALQAQTSAAAARLEERLSSSDNACQHMGGMVDDVQSLTSIAEERARQLAAEAEGVEKLLADLQGSAGATAALVERVATESVQARELLSTLKERCHEVPGLVAQCTERQNAMLETTEQCERQAAEAEQVAAALADSVSRSTPVIAKLDQATDKAAQTAHKLAERREAARATLERQQLLHEQDRELLEQLEAKSRQVEALADSLSTRAAEGTRVDSRLAEQCQRAAETIAQLAGQIDGVDARKQILDAAEQTLREFIEHAETVSGQIRKLQGQADAFEVHVSRLLERPALIVADAKAQSAQLQGVCRAVRKVFAGLSQSTLQANRRIEQFNRMSHAAESRTQRLSAETTQAAETLRTWVVEAVGAQSRLAKSLERCPTISQTHPLDSLRGLASLTKRPSLADSDPAVEHAPVEPPGPENQTNADAAVPARARKEEINQLIQEAHKFAEDALQIASSD